MFLYGVFIRGKNPPVLLGEKKGFSKDRKGGQKTAEKNVEEKLNLQV